VGVNRDVREVEVAADIEFVDFLAPHVEAARRALAARFGSEMSAELGADIAAWAWEHQDRLRKTANPGGYLFRVGQSRARQYRRWARSLPRSSEPLPEAESDPALHAALQKLTAKQRTVLLLVHAFGYSYAETATQLDISEGAVRNQLHRGLARIRILLEGGADSDHG
jgi:RNA polymerase sigma factor (sigma-70 family)